MLDMLFTADAAHKHGLELSSPHTPSSPTCNGAFLAQMPLSIIGSVLRRQTPSPSLAIAHAAHNADPTNNATDATTPQKRITTYPDTPVSSRPASSGGSSAATDDLPKKRTLRSKTTYICARPPRRIECPSKLHIRPKVLLQLHQVIPSQRPKPTYEVVPFSLLPARSTRRLTRTFNTKERLGPNDLLVVKAEAYGKEEDAKSDDDHWGEREVVGVICPGKGERSATEICMDDGTSQWEVTHMHNGGFEFNTTNDHGLTLKARWVLKPAHARRVSGMSTSSQLSPTFPPGQDEKKYTFSTIRANSRRHPIIATMTRSRIDVMDSYTIPSATSPSSPGSIMTTHTPALTPASIDMDSFFSSEQLPVHTDDALRKFILVTGVWVASQTDYSSTPSLESSATFRPSNNRTVSMSFIDSSRSASPASTVEETRRSFPKLLRTSRERLPRSTSFTAPSPSPPLIVSAPLNTSPVQKIRARRANSTGTGTLHSMSGSMRRRYGLAFANQPLEESEEERQVKRSVELLRIRELALPTTLERSSSDLLVTEIAAPVIIPPSPTDPTSPAALLSAPLPDPERTRKTQSAYTPVATAGLWDSGVTGVKSRPTSMSVLNKKMAKMERKRERSKTKGEKRERKVDEKESEDEKKGTEWWRFKGGLRRMLGRGKA